MEPFPTDEFKSQEHYSLLLVEHVAHGLTRKVARIEVEERCCHVVCIIEKMCFIQLGCQFIMTNEAKECRNCRPKVEKVQYIETAT